MKTNLGEIICEYRQKRKMTQDEFASKLGVTSQAISKWERGNGLPDISLIEGICRILDITANTLFGLEDNMEEKKSVIAEKEIKRNMLAEPIVLDFGAKIIPCIIEGLKTDYVNEKRKNLVIKNGMLMPTLRIVDNINLEDDKYRVLSYDRVLFEGHINFEKIDVYKEIIDKVFECCEENYEKVINKSIVKDMIDNLNENFPGIAEGLVPEKISYLQVERKLQSMIKEGKSIRNLIHILEAMEEEMM